jgi:hypothetical protein
VKGETQTQPQNAPQNTSAPRVIKRVNRGKPLLCQDNIFEICDHGDKCRNAHDDEQLATDAYRKKFDEFFSKNPTFCNDALTAINQAIRQASSFFIQFKQTGIQINGLRRFLLDTITVEQIKNGFAPQDFNFALQFWYQFACYTRSDHTDVEKQYQLRLGDIEDYVWELARRTVVPCMREGSFRRLLACDPDDDLFREKYRQMFCLGGKYCKNGYHKSSYINLSKLTGSEPKTVDIDLRPIQTQIKMYVEARNKLYDAEDNLSDQLDREQANDDGWTRVGDTAIVHMMKNEVKQCERDCDELMEKIDEMFETIKTQTFHNIPQFLNDQKCAVDDYNQQPLVNSTQSVTQIALVEKTSQTDKKANQKEYEQKKAEKLARMKAQEEEEQAEKERLRLEREKSTLDADDLIGQVSSFITKSTRELQEEIEYYKMKIEHRQRNGKSSAKYEADLEAAEKEYKTVLEKFAPLTTLRDNLIKLVKQKEEQLSTFWESVDGATDNYNFHADIKEYKKMCVWKKNIGFEPEGDDLVKFNRGQKYHQLLEDHLEDLNEEIYTTCVALRQQLNS